MYPLKKKRVIEWLIWMEWWKSTYWTFHLYTIAYFVKFECWGRVALHKHVATGSLIFNGTVFLLDFDNLWRSRLSSGFKRNWGSVKSAFPFWFFITSGIFTSSSTLVKRPVRIMNVYKQKCIKHKTNQGHATIKETFLKALIQSLKPSYDMLHTIKSH